MLHVLNIFYHTFSRIGIADHNFVFEVGFSRRLRRPRVPARGRHCLARCDEDLVQEVATHSNVAVVEVSHCGIEIRGVDIQ